MSIGKIRKALFGGTVALGTCLSLPAGATTLQQALIQALRNNPALMAEQATLAAAQEQVEAAKGGYYPQVKLFGGVGTSHQDVEISGFPVNIDTIILNSRQVGVEVDQALYQGGKITGRVDAAENLRAAEEANYHGVEQKVLLDAARAYMDVLQAQAVVDLETGNQRVLQQALDAAQASFDNGEVTHTDVDQAKARLAGAQATLIQAQGALAGARSEYERVVGNVPDALTEPQPLAGLPANQDEALKLADNNYVVVAAQYQSAVAQDNVDIASSVLKPSIYLSGQVSKSREPSFPFERFDDRSVMLQFSMPLYSGGTNTSEVQAARHQADSRAQQLNEVQRGARDQVVQAWQAYQTAQAGLTAIEVQITAAQSAYDGVEAEYKEGERTTLDVLNAEQELLNAKVNQVRAKRDEIVAEYGLKAAVGMLTAADLKLPAAGSDGG